MWYMVPKRRRKRSGHRQTLQVAPVPIIFSRLPGALSTRSLDVSERQNPGFFMRSEFASLQWFCSFRNSLCPVGKVGGKKTERKNSGSGHRRHLRASPMTRISELREFTAVTAALTSLQSKVYRQRKKDRCQ